MILRHKPEVIGITLDRHGWADVAALIEGVNKTHPLDMETLEQIVAEDEKQRYSFNEDKTRIRANQGSLRSRRCGAGGKGTTGNTLSRNR